MDSKLQTLSGKRFTGERLEPVMFAMDRSLRTLKGSEEITLQDLLNLERRNKILWREVLNNSMWFVSPRGDRFSSKGDQEMSEQDVKSITFNTEKRYPREHKVTCRYEDGEIDFYWLDVNQNLLNENRELLLGDPRTIGKLADIFLQRLYYITSGVLSQKEDVEQKEEGLGGIKFEYRRAHYRIIKSTPGRRITMESRAAITHAREILEDYGINIYKETKRRREAGTLKPEEYLTFVREVSPKEVAENVLPNEIVFDPGLLTIPNR